MGKSVLTVTASVQREASVSRQLTDALVSRISETQDVDTLVERDLSIDDMELLTGNHVGAFYSPPEDRSDEQRSLLAQSDRLVSELKQADILVIGTPMYNFSVPASLKAWIDLVCRVGETFRYTDKGPEGLAQIEKAYIVVATGGVPVNSPVDFLVPYLKQFAAFIGVKEVEVIAADKTNQQKDEAIAHALEHIGSI